MATHVAKPRARRDFFIYSIGRIIMRPFFALEECSRSWYHFLMPKFGEMNPSRNLENPRPEVHEGTDRKELSKTVSPELTEVGKANTDPDSELAKGFEIKKQRNKRMEFREKSNIASDDIENPEDVYHNPTEELDARIDAGMNEEHEFGPDQIKGPRPELPPEIEEIDEMTHYMPFKEWSKLSREERKKIVEIRKNPRKAVAEVYMTPPKRFVRKKKKGEGDKKAA